MAKIARKTQKIFGLNAGFQQISEFGSLAESSPEYSTDPEDIQSKAAYLSGWFAAVIGSNSPAIEDMNALCYLYAYQLAYLFQNGIPEWNATTEYYTGSLATNSSGRPYVSLVDSNINQALTDATKWQELLLLPRLNNTTNASFVTSGQIPASAGATASDGQSATATFSQDAIMFTVSVATDRTSFLCYANYAAAAVTCLSDPSGIFLPTDTGTGIYVTKSASSGVITIKNRTGNSRAITFQAINSNFISTTAWS